MSKWGEKNLGDIAEIIMGQSPKSVYYNDRGEGLPFFQGVTDFGNKYPSETKWTSVAHKVAEPNDILFSVRAPVGQINVAHKKCAIGRGICAIRSRESQNDFLYFLLHGNIKKIEALGTGAVYDAINKTTLETIELLVPENQDEQSAIASVLASYDNLIANNEKRIKILEEMARLLYVEWLVKFKFPGHERSRLIDSGTEYGQIPEGWKVKRLQSLIRPQYGYTASAIKDADKPNYLRGTDINKKSYIEWANVPNCEITESDYAKYKVSKGDIFIIRMADPGKIGICEDDVNAVFASYLMRLSIVDDAITPYFLFYYLNSDRYQNYIQGAANGATRRSINSNHVGNINILVPSRKILHQFEEKMLLYRGLLALLVRKNANLEVVRDSLIPQLVTGKRELK